MKKFLIGLIVLMSVSFAGCSNVENSTPTSPVSVTESVNQIQEAQNEVTPVKEKKEYTVYITRTGSKYHSAGCRYLRQSSFPMDINDAINSGYDACSKCNP